MAARKKVIYTTVTEVVDMNTGRTIKEAKSNVYSLLQEPPFVKVYLSDLAKLLDLPDHCKNVVYALFQIMSFDGTIRLTMNTKLKMAEQLGIKEKSFRNYLTAIVKNGILLRTGMCEYEMNPYLFAKGHWNEIHKRREDFELKVRYKSNGTKTIEGNFCINE
jgi:hypothetical protein